MWTQSILVASILLASACSDGAMNGDTRELNAALAEGRAENARHEQACNVADAMPAVLDELGRHEQAMNGMMGRMAQGMGEMSSCSNSETNRVSTAMSSMRSEVDGHRVRLEAASDLQAAHHECSLHASTMDATLRGVVADLDQMSCMVGH